MRKLSDMNDLYIVLDVILLYKIFEHRSNIMQEIYGFNPSPCNSARTLDGCIQRNKPKVVLVLPTSPDVIQLFEKTVIGGFSCVNTRLACGNSFAKFSSKDFKKFNIDNSFKQRKRQDLKLIYRLQLDSVDSFNDRRIIAY